MTLDKRKYMQEIRLEQKDCLELLQSLSDSSIDLIVSSPPYCIGKAYEDPDDDIRTFENTHQQLFPELYRVLKPGGSICWQVGYHVFSTSIVPLDFIVYNIFTQNNVEFPLKLRNRIVWTFGHGLNSEKRLSGRHEIILWFTKGENYTFDLDSIRVPQKYPGKKAYKGKNKGKLSGNPLGKNPSDVWSVYTDVWDIPNVKANHVEKTMHPCQFPVAIPRRLIKALTKKNDIVLDPFMGVGSTGVAAILEGRRFIGSEINDNYFSICEGRINGVKNGTTKVREDKPIYVPPENTSLTKIPDEFINQQEVYLNDKEKKNK